jgi:hypothetical protein
MSEQRHGGMCSCGENILVLAQSSPVRQLHKELILSTLVMAVRQ